MCQGGYSGAYIGVVLIVGLLVGAAIIVLSLLILHCIVGRNPYACLERRRHGDETSTTPASVSVST